jgi:hypothetical protein
MESKKSFVRIWSSVDTEEIENHLMLIEDLYGSCGKCKKLGLNYLKDKICPSCNTVFKYVATNIKNQGEIIKILQRIQTNNLNLKLIEREDYNKAHAKDALNNLFK